MSKKLFAASIVAIIVCAQTAFAGFGWEDVVAKARKLATQPHVSRNAKLPPELASMDYDTFRTLRYVRERSPWYKLGHPFEIQFFHLGSLFTNPVAINEIADGKVVPFHYDASAFTLNDRPMTDTGDIGYAGFRLHYPLNTPFYPDELISFLGASYFRALGAGQRYGASARGLAIDTGVMTGEEFPEFVEFWIERPAPGAKNILVFALLDSPRMTGAFSFRITPALNTIMDVETVLFPRAVTAKIGIAPLTSMYLFGENTKNKFFDFRPEVHDSDGLLTANNNGEWLWRPLDNNKKLRISAFMDDNVKGFGLMQRDRDPRSYQDFEAFYQARPSVWVEPLAPFGPGVVELIEIPSNREIHDNVVAMFVPRDPLKPGNEYSYRYRLHWLREDSNIPSRLGKVISTYSGIGGYSGIGDENAVKFVIDFQGQALREALDIKDLSPVVETSTGTISGITLVKNPILDGYRLSFDFTPKGPVAELRAHLVRDNATVSEIWSYQWLE